MEMRVSALSITSWLGRRSKESLSIPIKRTSLVKLFANTGGGAIALP